MFRKIAIVTPPLDEPVTIQQLKAKARIDTDDDDAILDRLIVSAREKCEKYTRRSLITQTIDVWYDTWDGGIGIIDDLPRGNVQSIVAVYTYDYDNLEAAIETGVYVAQGNTIIFNTWPSAWRMHLGIKVRLVSGYGDHPENVPYALREGILEYATHLYDNPAGEGPTIEYAAMASQHGLPVGVIEKWHPFQIKIV